MRVLEQGIRDGNIGEVSAHDRTGKNYSISLREKSMQGKGHLYGPVSGKVVLRNQNYSISPFTSGVLLYRTHALHITQVGK